MNPFEKWRFCHFTIFSLLTYSWKFENSQTVAFFDEPSAMPNSFIEIYNFCVLAFSKISLYRGVFGCFPILPRKKIFFHFSPLDVFVKIFFTISNLPLQSPFHTLLRSFSCLKLMFTIFNLKIAKITFYAKTTILHLKSKLCNLNMPYIIFTWNFSNHNLKNPYGFEEIKIQTKSFKIQNFKHQNLPK